MEVHDIPHCWDACNAKLVLAKIFLISNPAKTDANSIAFFMVI
jgi:hypothetical protein